MSEDEIIDEEFTEDDEDIDLSTLDIVDLLNMFSEIMHEMEESGTQLIVVSGLLSEAADEISMLRSRVVEDITVYGETEDDIILQVTGDDVMPALHEAVHMWVDARLGAAMNSLNDEEE